MSENRIDSLAVNYPYTGYYFTPQQASNTSKTQTTYVSTPSFKSQQEALREHDVVEISAKQEVEKKKGLSKGAKWAIGLTAGLGTIAGTAVLVCKGKTNQLQKLYKEKLVLSNLPEKIDFVEAKTVQEGIDFAKNVLKIKEVSPDFTLDAINFANKGIVDVANANKGKCMLPQH